MRRSLTLLALGAFVLVAPTALAQSADAKENAKAAYARGLRAHDAGDFRSAAAAFAEADSYAPSAAALMAALDDAVQADDPVLGAELLDRSSRETPTPALAASIANAKKKLGGRAGKVRVDCPVGAKCATTIDGRSAEGPRWVLPGSHVVVVRMNDQPRERVVEVRAGETVVVAPDASMPPSPAPTPAPAPAPAPPPTPAPPPSSSGLSPTIVYVGAGLTVALGGAAVVTGLLAGGKHADFVNAHCDAGPAQGCTGLKDDGERFVHITNGLLVGTAVTAVATTVIALAFTNWKGEAAERAARAPGGLRFEF